MQPGEPTLYLGAGIAAHMLGKLAEARADLQETLRLDPRMTEAAVLLGEMTYQAGETEAAIRVYEDALALAPGHPRLQAQLDRWQKEIVVHGQFQRTLSPHFTVLFEGPEEQAMAVRAIDGLEAAYWRIGTSLLAYPSDVLTVVLYTQEQFRDITRSPQWAGGIYDGKIRIPMRGALDHPGELEKVLAHELTHALVRSLAARGVPTWLDEGLAVVFESDDLGWAEQLITRAPTLIPLTDLHDGFERLPHEQVALAYAESGLAVRVLLGRGGALSIAQFLQDLARGSTFPKAFEGRFFLTYEQFLATWSQLS